VYTVLHHILVPEVLSLDHVVRASMPCGRVAAVVSCLRRREEKRRGSMLVVCDEACEENADIGTTGVLRFIVGVNLGIAVDRGKTSTWDLVAGTEVGVVEAR
jgi:hypothetical protein